MSWTFPLPDGTTKISPRRKYLHPLGNGETNYAVCPKCKGRVPIGEIHGVINAEKGKIVGYRTSGTDGKLRCGVCNINLKLSDERSVLEYATKKNPTTVVSEDSLRGKLKKELLNRKSELGWTEQGLALKESQQPEQ